MNDLQKRRLEQVLSALTEFDDSLVQGQVARHFVETRRGADGALEIHANAEGLVRLACEILSLAKDGFEGKHRHFDDVGTLDHSEQDFVVVYKPAEWDRAKSPAD